MTKRKLTQKDITEHCSSHYCNSHDCKYMENYCHIREYVLDECNECVKQNCHGCENFR